jgi:hypothetical protein
MHFTFLSRSGNFILIYLVTLILLCVEDCGMHYDSPNSDILQLFVISYFLGRHIFLNIKKVTGHDV